MKLKYPLLLSLGMLCFAQSSVYAHNSGTIDSEQQNPVGVTYEMSNHPLESTTLTIIHDTHFHGNYGNPDKAKNIANYFGVADEIRAKYPNSLFIGNGDDLATSVLSSSFHGKHIVDAFNAGHLTSDTFGNHDFDMGPEQLEKMIGESQFTWVSANLIDSRTQKVFGEKAGARPYIIKTVNGIKVGITGLIHTDAPEVTTMGPYAKVLDPIKAMKAIIPKMKADGAQMIIVASHLSSPDAREVAEHVDGIDLIVGDHAAFAFETPEKIHNTLLWFIGDEFKYLGQINFEFKNGKIADFNFHRYTLEDEVKKVGFKPDPAVKAVMDKYNGQLAASLNVVIGKTNTDLDVMKASQRKGETAIGDFVADSMRAYTKADIGFMNGGGIRAERIFPVGNLTKRDVMDALPFTNYVVEIKVSGKVLKEALENSVSQINEVAGRFAQVSGMSYSFDLSKPVGSRISDVKVGGKALDMNKSYSLATVDYVAGGGDGYDMFKDADVLVDANNGPLLSTLVVDAIQSKDAINPKIEGRIKQL